MSSGWKKWECPPDMLTVEEKLTTLQLTERQIEEISLAYYDYEMNRASSPEQKAAWAQLSVRKKSKLIKSSLQEGLVEDFQLWLQGRSKYNVTRVKETKLNPISGKYEETFRECTPWGNKSLLHLDDVCAWLKLPTLNRDKVAKGISILKMTTPLDLEQAWIYYKYICRGIAIDGEILKEKRYANVFDYIEKQPQKAEIDPDTRTTRLVNDDRFTPFSMNNPSMPKFNEHTYRQNYNYFNNQLNIGNLGVIMDESEKFADLTHDDKLVLLLKGSSMAEPGYVLEMPGELHEVEGVATPVPKVAAGPYLLSALAGTLADALGDTVKTVSGDQDKKIKKTIDMLVKIQKEQTKAYNDTNHVLLAESKKAREILEGIRAGNVNTASAFREFKDSFNVMIKLMERDKERRPPIKPAISVLEAVSVNDMLPRPPPDTLEPRPALVAPVKSKDKVEPPPIITPEIFPDMEPEGNAPDVEDATPVKVSIEEPVFTGVPVGIDETFPRLDDEYELVNRAFNRLETDTANKISGILNERMREDTLLEMSRAANGNPEELKRLIMRDSVNLFNEKVDKLKDGLNNDKYMRAHAFNHIPDDSTIHKQYLNSVYDYVMGTSVDVDDKRNIVSTMRTAMFSPSAAVAAERGVSPRHLKTRLDTTIKKIAGVDMIDNITIEDSSRLKNDIFKKYMDRDDLPPDTRLHEFEEAVTKHETLGVKGPYLMEALESTMGKNNELIEDITAMREEVSTIRELLNNPDAGTADSVKKLIEKVGQYEVYTEKQQIQLNELRGAAQRVEELEVERNKLQIEMNNLITKNNEQSAINEEAHGVIGKYEATVKQYEHNISQLQQMMAIEQGNLSSEVTKYQQLSEELKKSATGRIMELAEKERELNLLRHMNSQIITDAQSKLAVNEQERAILMAKLNDLESKYAQVSGPQVEEHFKKQNEQGRALESELNRVNTAYTEKIEQLDREINELRGRVESSESQARQAGQQIQLDQAKIKHLDIEMEKLQERLHAENTRAIEKMKQIKLLESQMSNKDEHIKQLKDQNEELARLERQHLNTKEEIDRLRNEKNTSSQNSKNVKDLQSLLEQKEKMEFTYKTQVETLNKELSSARSELESIKNNSKKIDSGETAKLKKQINDLRSQLSTNEKTKETIEKTKRDAYAKNSSEMDKIKQYAIDLEARFNRSERVRGTLERLLTARRETQNDVDALADRFQEGLRYMASETHSENLEKMFAYGDDDKALTKTRAGRALIDSWNMLSKFKEQKNKDMNIIKKQAELVKQMESQLVILKKKNKETINNYEKQIRDTLNPSTPYVTPTVPETGPGTFHDNYAGLATHATAEAAEYQEALNKRGGARATITPEEYPQVLQRQQEYATKMASAITERANLEMERSGLEKLKEDVLMKESQLVADKKIMRAEEKYEIDLELARIERLQAVADRGIYALEEHINTFKTVSTFYGGLLSGKTNGTSKRELERESTIYFSQAQKGSIESAKTAGLNIINAYSDAIRTTPGLLFSLDNTQLNDYANTLHLIADKLAQSSDPENMKLRERMAIEYGQLRQVASMDPIKKKELSDSRYQSAYNAQFEINKLNGTRGDIEDQQLDEMENTDVENDPRASFAPSYEKQQEQKEEIKRIINKSLNREKLTVEESNAMNEYVSQHGGVNHKNIGTEILQVVRSKIIETYMETLDNPDDAISEMFQDTMDTARYKTSHLVGNQILIKRTLDDLRNIAQEHKEDSTTERSSRIIQALANKSPEILNEMLAGTVFANFMNTQGMSTALASTVEQDLAKYRIKNEKSIEELNNASEYIANSIGSQSFNEQGFMEYITLIEKESLSEKEAFARANGLETAMGYLLNKGNIENQALRLQRSDQINGVDFDTYEYVSSNLADNDKEDFSIAMKGFAAEVENYTSLNTSTYVQQLEKLTHIAKKAITKKLTDSGHNAYSHIQKNPLPDIKRLYDNTKAFTTIISNLERVNYAASGGKKERLVTMIKNASKSVLYDTQRALRDVERLKVRATQKQVSVWDLRAAIVKGRQSTKRRAIELANVSLQKSKAF